MPALEYPDQAEIDSWEIEEGGVRDGSSPNETLEVDASTATRRFLVNWESRFDFAKWMLGYSEIWNNSGTLTLSRLLPQVHPDRPEWACTKITRMSGHKFDEEESDGEVNAYVKAWVECFYEHVPYAMTEDADIVTEFERYTSWPDDSQGGGEYLQLPGATLTAVANPAGPHVGSNIDGKKIPMNVGKVIPEERFVVRWRRLPEDAYAPDSALYQRLFGTSEGDGVPYKGAINSEEIFGRPSGTVLLEDAIPRRLKSPLGEGFEWDIEFHFAVKVSGWNWVWMMESSNVLSEHNDFYMASATGTFATADLVEDYDSIYNARDLIELFDVNPPP